MRLCQSEDFYDAIKAAEDYFDRPGLTAQFIEKDYYVTESLRFIEDKYPNMFIFKGGTSLSKGWALIERFSEDIDLFLKRDLPDRKISKNQVDKIFKEIETELLNDAALGFSKFNVTSDKGVRRDVILSYKQNFSGNEAIANRVRLEMGTRSGTHPTDSIQLSSYLAQFLRENKETLGAIDEAPFNMNLLHFRRTFVEKMFAIHSAVMKYKNDNILLGSNTRHYYDLFCLAQKPEIKLMLQQEEYQLIKQDCDSISKSQFENNYCPPDDLNFSKSEALFPTEELRKIISTEYNKQCSILCYQKKYPKWDEVESCFEELRNFL